MLQAWNCNSTNARRHQHASNDKTRNELTGHVPGPELDEVEDFCFFLNRRFQNIVQEVGRVSRRWVEGVGVSLREAKAL